MRHASKVEYCGAPARLPLLGRLMALCALAAIGSQAAAADQDVAAPEDGRGAALYEAHCVACHDSLMHVRSDRRCSTYAAVTSKVRFWSDLQRLQWTEQDIDDVAAYLNTRFYHFAVLSLDEGARR